MPPARSAPHPDGSSKTGTQHAARLSRLEVELFTSFKLLRFYKSFIEMVKHDFLRVLNLALTIGQLSVSMREGDIILLLKKGDTRHARPQPETETIDHRPITLLQSDLQNSS
eukprot:scaffold91036_cov27-Tisochrysis_lutea.AAC.10